MTWTINFSKSAEKEYSKLSKDIKTTLKKYLREKVIHTPRQYGKPLVSYGSVKLWRYRIQNYRLICQIKDDELTILVVRIGKRDAIYKQR